MSSPKNNEELITEWRDVIHTELIALGQSLLGDSKRLQAATTYVLQGRGKRLRALLALAINCDLLGERVSHPAALHAAIALEMLHAASLVHDDLPALDNDDMRRGRPSCHRQFNEATAILTGDYLVGRAFSVVSEGALPGARQLQVLALLAKAWGDLCVGQQVDIDRPSQPSEIDRLMQLKTGALFGAAAACGAVCAECDPVVAERFHHWGRELGVLFQKLDDLSDGDAPLQSAFDKEAEIGELRQGLVSLNFCPMEITQYVFDLVVGG